MSKASSRLPSAQIRTFHRPVDHTLTTATTTARTGAEDGGLGRASVFLMFQEGEAHCLLAQPVPRGPLQVRAKGALHRLARSPICPGHLYTSASRASTRSSVSSGSTAAGNRQHLGGLSGGGGGDRTSPIFTSSTAQLRSAATAAATTSPGSNHPAPLRVSQRVWWSMRPSLRSLRKPAPGNQAMFWP